MLIRKSLYEDVKMSLWKFHNALTFFRFITDWLINGSLCTIQECTINHCLIRVKKIDNK